MNWTDSFIFYSHGAVNCTRALFNNTKVIFNLLYIINFYNIYLFLFILFSKFILKYIMVNAWNRFLYIYMLNVIMN